MAVNARWKGLPWLVAAGVVVGLVVLGVALLKCPERVAAPGASPPSAAAPAAPAAPVADSAPAATPPEPSKPAAGAMAAYLPPPPSVPADQEPQVHPVDLKALRAKLPDNLYWTVAAPTEDPQVLKQRDEDSRRWNDVYGKVLSGTATEEEIRQYYSHRRQVSEDMMAFANTVLADYGDRLPEQERGLYELSVDMHRTRLAELPRQEQEAFARRQEQERRREAWRQGRQQP
ncbi:hypothetical protein JY651_04265 [Pyxidicoccus parkwayensis]|uniref:Lipase helper protein n=1 Tax=Pyxidicoccus parkwayensis TaxID=2813578 RepID=A0ABX7P0D8_9BACT|nr:hypothetical protein [Pyxidicoccus parkwaysis]QSQ24193.1 hypothetical protein JY651_04265 [Pyxidicoccus parkwaysis]